MNLIFRPNLIKKSSNSNSVNRKSDAKKNNYIDDLHDISINYKPKKLERIKYESIKFNTKSGLELNHSRNTIDYDNSRLCKNAFRNLSYTHRK